MRFTTGSRQTSPSSVVTPLLGRYALIALIAFLAVKKMLVPINDFNVNSIIYDSVTSIGNFRENSLNK